MKILFATAAALLLSAGLAQASNGWTSSGVNFRDGPGKWHSVIGHLPHCASVEIGRYEGGWVHVGWQGTWGWVSKGYVRTSNAHCGHRPTKKYKSY